MKVLVADKFEAEGLAALRDMGCAIDYEPDLKGETLAAAAEQSRCRVLIVRSTKVGAAVIETAPELGLIIRAGAGTNTIDIASASQRSVFVANCPGKNAAAVAELTLGLILALDRRIPDNVRDLRNGQWAKKEYSRARGLKGRTLGILGVGQIAQEVIARARAFDMNVVAWSRSLTAAAADALDIVRVDLPEEVAVCCDILSVHLAATPETHHLVGREVLKELHDGAYFVNTARSEVVDYAALADAVRTKHLRVALDVFDNEPGADGEFCDAMVGLDGIVYGTHHIGASTDQAQLAIADETVHIVSTYMKTGQVPNCVNLSRGRIPEGVLMVRHVNRPGVLANVLGQLAKDGINVREMENVICAGEAGACAQIRLDAKPSRDLMQRIEGSDASILSVALTTPR